MPFSLHEMAMEYRIAARPAPSCEPKNIEFLLDSDMYLWILSLALSQLLDNYAERGVRKIKIKQKVSGCFRTDGGADDFAKLHSIAETAMKNGNSKFNAILAVVQQ